MPNTLNPKSMWNPRDMLISGSWERVHITPPGTQQYAECNPWIKVTYTIQKAFCYFYLYCIIVTSASIPLSFHQRETRFWEGKDQHVSSSNSHILCIAEHLMEVFAVVKSIHTNKSQCPPRLKDEMEVVSKQSPSVENTWKQSFTLDCYYIATELSAFCARSLPINTITLNQ